MLESINKTIEYAINLASLGTWADLSSILQNAPHEPSATALAWALAILKWGLLFSALFFFFRTVCDRLGFTSLVALILSAAALIPILLFYNTPWNDADIMAGRISAFMHAFEEDRDYVPSLYRAVNLTTVPIKMLNGSISGVVSSLPKNGTIPVVSGQQGLPAITTAEVDLSWLGVAIYLALAAGIAYVLLRLSKLLAGLAFFVILAVAMGFREDIIASVVAIVLCAYLTLLLVRSERWSKFRFLACYPLAVIVVLILYILQPPGWILTPGLIVALVLTLFPLFYVVGIAFYMVGEVLERREKLGMKVKPKKVIEEQAGEWDPVMVAVLLTAIFIAAVSLFGLTLSGLGVFLSTSYGLFKL